MKFRPLILPAGLFLLTLFALIPTYLEQPAEAEAVTAPKAEAPKAAVPAPSPPPAAPAPKPAPVPTHPNVSYGPHPNQLLDVYLPGEDTWPTPVLVWYGGIWQASKHAPDPNRFLPKGVAVIAVQTRTMADATKDKAAVPISYVLEDACRAVQFVRYNARKWHLNGRRIGVGGGSQGSLPALYVGVSGEHANPQSDDRVERVSSKVTCVAAYRSQPTIDPRRMQEWVPGVVWGAPALGCSFEESLKRRDELLPLIARWSPDTLLSVDDAPIYFENEWGLTQPEGITEGNYKVHSPAWAVGFQKAAQDAGARCLIKYPGHPTAGYEDIWDFIVKQLKAK